MTEFRLHTILIIFITFISCKTMPTKKNNTGKSFSDFGAHQAVKFDSFSNESTEFDYYCGIVSDRFLFLVESDSDVTSYDNVVEFVNHLNKNEWKAKFDSSNIWLHIHETHISHLRDIELTRNIENNKDFLLGKLNQILDLNISPSNLSDYDIKNINEGINMLRRKTPEILLDLEMPILVLFGEYVKSKGDGYSWSHENLKFKIKYVQNGELISLNESYPDVKINGDFFNLYPLIHKNLFSNWSDSIAEDIEFNLDLSGIKRFIDLKFEDNLH